ncbi:hypothetical protein GGI25_003667 [Coemansia spiralis]|uniref:Uncharacterized protein n=1 Tax=Coemansia spiralis TaxID=417178 RepID=A0A9W8G670_9FUNG|nr:hypothetical protein GGI25_003667 [Coemansia spiralis]
MECANTSFLKWSNKWYHDACCRSAKTQYRLNKVPTLLQGYLLWIESAQEAMQLASEVSLDRLLMCGLLNSVYSSTASQIIAGAVARVLFNGFSWRSSLADTADIGLTNLNLYPKADHNSILITDSCKVRLPVDRALIQKELKDHGVHTEIRSLAAGDYL